MHFKVFIFLCNKCVCARVPFDFKIMFFSHSRENDGNESKRETPNYVLLVIVILLSVGLIILLATGVIRYWRRLKCRKGMINWLIFK